jgi:hypothetical protein
LFRAIKLIVTAILLSRPGMPAAEATRYARVLQDEAVKRDFDPLTAVAIIHFETRWHPGLVSPDGEDYGLGQIRARYVGACRGDEDPVNSPSDACRAAKASLLVGETNLRRMGVIITANRELCKEKTGKADLPRWLAGYEGLSFPGRDKWCAPIAKTMEVVAYRKKLVEMLAPRPPVRAVTTVAARGNADKHGKPGKSEPRAVAPAPATAKARPPRAGAGVSPTVKTPPRPADREGSASKR